MNPEQSHEHITTADLRKIWLADEYDPTDEEAALMMAVQMKKETCDVCFARAQLFYAAVDLFGESFAAMPAAQASEALAARVAKALQEGLGQMDAQLQARVAAWLGGAREMLHSLDSLSLRPAFAGAARGADEEAAEQAQAAIEIEALSGEDGFFEFSVAEPMQASLRIDASTAEGEPACIVILSRDGAPSKVLPLKDLLGRKTTGRVDLEPDDYIGCVIAAPDENRR